MGKSAVDWNLEGNELFDEGKYKEALKAFKNARKADANNRFAWFNIGNTYLKLEEFNNAIDPLQHAIELDPNYVDAFYILGLVFFKSNKLENALDSLQRAIEIDSKDTFSLYLIGSVYYQQDLIDNAISFFLKALELDNHYDDAWGYLELCYEKKGDTNKQNKAKNRFLQGLRSTDEVKDWNAKGKEHYKNKNYEKAIEDFKRAVDVDPNYKTGYYNIASSYDHLKKYDEAIKYFKLAIEIDPSYKDAENQLGLIYFSKEDYVSAIAHFLRVIQIDPNYAVARYNTGDSYRKLKDYDNAIEFLKQSLSIDPEYLNAENKLGLVYWEKKDFRAAIEHFTRATEIDPKYKSAWYNIGSSYNQLEEYDNAIPPLEKAIEIDPNYRDAHNRMGIVLFNAKKYSEAIPWFSKTAKLDPKFKSAFFNIGNSYKQMKQYVEATIPYTEALRIDRNYDRAWDDLAECYEKSGRPEKAEQARNRTLILQTLDERLEEKKGKFKDYLIKLSAVYKEIQFHKIITKTGLKMEFLEELLEEMIMKGELKARISGDSLVFTKSKSEKKKDTKKDEHAAKFKKKKVKAKRGGNWKIEGGQSVFFYKVKVQNESKFLIGNIQVVLTSIPHGLSAEKQMYKIESLKPGAYESPTFKLMASESCVGDTVEGLVTFTDPMGKSQTITIEPFEICYVCNLLTPKEISKKDFDEKVEFMEDKKLIIESDLEPSELEAKIAEIVMNCNFAMLQQMEANRGGEFRKLEAFAQGLYDKQDVGLSIAMKKVKKEAKKGAKSGSKLVIKAMSDKEEKIIDLLKDFNNKLDDIKSDTELIKEYSAQLEDIFDKTKDLEGFLVDKLGSDFNNIKHAFKAYKAGDMGKAGLIKEGLKMIGKKFIKKIIA